MAYDLEEAVQKLVDNVAGFERRTLVRIGKRIKAIKELSAYDTKALENMRDIGKPIEEMQRDLSSVTALNIKEVQTILVNNMAAEMERTRELYSFNGIKFIEYAENEVAQQIVKHWAEATAGEMMNLSRTKAIGFSKEMPNGEVKFKSIKGALQSAIDKAVVAVRSGTSDFNSAMSDTIKDLGGSGVVTNYGSGVTRSVESAVRANILYGARQSAQEYLNYVGEKFDADGFEVDYHPHPRPTHEFMGGMMYSYHGDVTIDGVTYKDGKEALERLQDYGCLHYQTPIILGISQPTYDPKDLKERKKQDKEIIEYTTPAGNVLTGTKYRFTQRQRALERTMREQRKTMELAKTADNSELANTAQTKLKELKASYDDLCDSVGLQKTPERLKIK